LKPTEEGEPPRGEMGELSPRGVPACRGAVRGAAARPSACCGPDLLWGDPFTGPLGQAQGCSDGEGVAGDDPQGRGRQRQFGTVNEEAAPFLGQWAIPVAGEGPWRREKLLEHDRDSVDVRRQPMDSLTINSGLCCKEMRKEVRPTDLNP